MLRTSLQREDTSKIYVDLLTQQDLAALKAKKQGLIVSKPDPSKVDPKGKRYLIMTQFGEYEKVHFPLPLSYLEEPDIQTLRKTLTRLQDTSDYANESFYSQTKSMDDFYFLERDNAAMRAEIEEMERQFAATHGDNFYQATQDNTETQSQYDAYRQQAEQEIAALNAEVKAKEKELHQVQMQLNKQKGTHTSGFSMQ